MVVEWGCRVEYDNDCEFLILNNYLLKKNNTYVYLVILIIIIIDISTLIKFILTVWNKTLECNACDKPVSISRKIIYLSLYQCHCEEQNILNA